jgi:hypothetical protein
MRHFWRTPAILPHPRYCVVCIALTADRRGAIPTLLRWLLSQPALHTKRQRCGRVVRLASQLTEREEHLEARYYYRLSDPVGLEPVLRAARPR